MNLSFYEGLQNVVKLSVVVFLPISLEKQLVLHVNLHMNILVGSLETIMFYLCQRKEASSYKNANIGPHLNISVHIFLIKIFVSLPVDFLQLLQEWMN